MKRGSRGEKDAAGIECHCRALFERSQLPVAAVEGAGHIVRSVNAAFCRLVGKEEKDLVGNPLAQAIAQSAVPEVISLLDSVHRTGTPESLPEQEHEGTPLAYWSYSAWPVAASKDSPERIMVQVTDVTQDMLFHRQAAHMNEQLLLTAVRQNQAMEKLEPAERALRRSEERYRTLFETMIEGFCTIEVIFDANGKPVDYRYLEVNPAFEAQTGLHNARGRLMRELAPDHEGRWFEIYGRVALTGEPARFENEAKALGRYYAVYAWRVGGPESRRVASVLNDITERKQAEEALRQAHDTLEERVRERTAELERRTAQLRSLALELSQAENRERKRLAAILHDHLQQILVGAKLGIQLAQKEAVGDSLRESIRSVASLLDESIKVSRSLTVELSPPILHEAGLVPGVKWLARWMGEKQGLSIEVTADTDVPPDTDGLSALLFQSIQELLLNVVKHAGAAAAHVSISEDNGKLRIVVADKGAGFDVAQAEARGSEGGFGLFSIRERIDLLGGRMDIDSSPGMGTRVTLVAPLPKRAAPARVSATAETTAGLPAGSASTAELGSAGKIRVLVADDHTMVREGLTKLIKGQADMEIAGEASDGLAAVEMAHQLRPDVIIMDLSMPRMGGIEATERIKAELPGIRVIGLSMYEKSDREEAMRRAGAVAYLTKDGPSENLIAAIRAACASKH